jgi:hypothetical protein
MTATALMGAIVVSGDDPVPFYVFLASVIFGTAATMFARPR